MKNILHLFKIHLLSPNKTTYFKETYSSGKTDIKTKTMAYLKMPMSFDFTAYFDESDLDSIPENI